MHGFVEDRDISDMLEGYYNHQDQGHAEVHHEEIVKHLYLESGRQHYNQAMLNATGSILGNNLSVPDLVLNVSNSFWCFLLQECVHTCRLKYYMDNNG